MSWWLWIAFCTLCAGIFLYPSRYNLLIAQQSITLGRKAGLVSALGAAMGIGLAMTIATMFVSSWIILIAPLSDFLGWVGMAWLIMIALWTIGTVPFRAALPDNDNLPKSGLLSIYADSCLAHMKSARFISFFIAITVQFNIAANSIAIEDFIVLQIGATVLALGLLSLVAIFPRFLITWLRNLGQKIAARKPQNKTLIAGKAVKARYRKIAA